MGIGPSAIEYRLRTGQLHRVFVGVYAVGHSVLPPSGRAHAAVLACEPDALLSHRSAAERWGLIRTSRHVIDVTVPRRLGGQPGIQVHFVRAMHPGDRAVRDGIPVTTVARTLLDFAAVADRRQLERAWDESLRKELFDLGALEDVLTRTRGHRGAKPLAELIAAQRRPEPTRSELEAMFLDLCRSHGIPLPACNVIVAGEEVDAYWPWHGLVVELDGWEHHRTRRDRERDLLKEERIKLAGHPFMRFGYRRVADRPHEVAAVLSKCLGTAPILGGSLPG